MLQLVAIALNNKDFFNHKFLCHYKSPCLTPTMYMWHFILSDCYIKLYIIIIILYDGTSMMDYNTRYPLGLLYILYQNVM